MGTPPTFARREGRLPESKDDETPSGCLSGDGGVPSATGRRNAHEIEGSFVRTCRKFPAGYWRCHRHQQPNCITAV